MSPEKSGRRTWNFYLRYFLFLIILLFLAGEVTLRFMGYTAWSPPDQSFSVSPGDSYFAPDTLLGYRGKPGKFEAILADSLKFTVTHDAEGWRISQPQNEPLRADSLPRHEVWVLGCSFTHGFGVPDSATYVWKLQERFPSLQFRNYGMDAYGTVQSLLFLDQMLQEGHKPPAMIILAYGGFHNQRNTSNRYWRKVLSGREVANGLRYPHMRFEGDSLHLDYSQLEYRRAPGMRWSAFLHYFEQAYNRSEDAQLRSREVSERLIAGIAAICKENDTQMILAGIHDHNDTRDMLQHFAGDARMHTVDISQDLDDPKMRILPSDGHPNGRGHSLMARDLGEFLDQNFTIPETPKE